jgi:CheY-like chemotaxis protein
MQSQSQHPGPSSEARRIVICDYNALLLSVTGLLRMSGYSVFQAHDGWAAQELCALLPDIDLLVLNTYGTGIDVGELCHSVRSSKRGLPILHIGSTIPHGLPPDVPTLPETFTADSLLLTVQALMEPALLRAAPIQQAARKPTSYPNGRR